MNNPIPKQQPRSPDLDTPHLCRLDLIPHPLPHPSIHASPPIRTILPTDNRPVLIPFHLNPSPYPLLNQPIMFSAVTVHSKSRALVAPVLVEQSLYGLEQRQKPSSKSSQPPFPHLQSVRQQASGSNVGLQPLHQVRALRVTTCSRRLDGHMRCFVPGSRPTCLSSIAHVWLLVASARTLGEEDGGSVMAWRHCELSSRSKARDSIYRLILQSRSKPSDAQCKKKKLRSMWCMYFGTPHTIPHGAKSHVEHSKTKDTGIAVTTVSKVSVQSHKTCRFWHLYGMDAKGNTAAEERRRSCYLDKNLDKLRLTVP